MREDSDNWFGSVATDRDYVPTPRQPLSTWRRLIIASWALVAVVLLGAGARKVVFEMETWANVRNVDDVMTMLRSYKTDRGYYPRTLTELEPYNIVSFGRNQSQRAQDLKKNVFGQPLLYTSNGTTYTLVSPGRHGYQRATVIPWPNHDGAHHPDTSLVIVDDRAKELALARGQARP